MATTDFHSHSHLQAPGQELSQTQGQTLIPYSGFRFGFNLGLALLTWFLLFIGAMVTSTNSGLSVPDWPTTFGHNMFLYPLSKMTGGIFYEHGHRLFASLIGFLVTVNAVFVLRFDSRKWLRRVGYLTFFVVVAQGILGGITVRLKLPVEVSSSHAALAELFFGLTAFMAAACSRAWIHHENKSGFNFSSKLFRMASILSAIVFTQIVVGAIMRHSFAGLAIPTFPKAFNGWIPPFWNFGLVFNFTHTRVLPLLITAFAVTVIMHSFKQNQTDMARRWAWVLCFLLPIQIMLGVSVIWLFKAPVPTSFHLFFGAATFITCLQIAWWAGREDGVVSGSTSRHPPKQSEVALGLSSTVIKGSTT